MQQVISRDGTSIAYEKRGTGPALILVDGALCYRGMGPSRPLATQLAPSFTVYSYDRRGRGESGNTLPYAVEREIEDIDALIQVAGGSALVFGISSGAALALDAAAHLTSIQKLAVYEAPFIVDDSHPARPDDYLARMDGLIAADQRGAAVRLFMRTVGAPALIITMMQIMPTWSKLKKVAHTLPYDFRVLGDTGKGQPLSTTRWASVTIPTLVMDGGNSPDYMRHGMQALTNTLPHAHYRTLDGQTHMVKAHVIAPVIKEFFA